MRNLRDNVVTMNSAMENAGSILRQWRQRRRLSQLALASEANISQRHLSFVESGRSQPSREMVIRLSEWLDVPLRERNTILTAAGYAPYYPDHGLGTPDLSGIRRTIDQILKGHLPHPALAVDRYWNLIAANDGAQSIMAGVAPHLLEGKINVLRLSLHPDGLAPRILNLAEWRTHLLARLDHDIAHSADAKLAALREQLAAFPVPPRSGPMSSDPAQEGRIAIPLKLKTDDGPLSFLSTTTVFGTAVDVTLSEITIEAFFPADERTARAMARGKLP